MDKNLIDKLQLENENLKKKLEETIQQLKKYTNGNNHKRYYQKNKEKVKENGLNYLKKLKETNPEKLKEYRRNYYLKKKQKQQIEKENSILENQQQDLKK